jgi:hypothetical protein
LTFTVFVLPFEERSDVEPLIADIEARTPYPVPTDCAVTPFDDVGLSLSATNRQRILYTIDGDGMSLTGNLALLYAGENTVRWYPDEWSTITLDAALAGSGTAALVTNEIRSSDHDGEHLATTFLFPAEGCWELTATTEDGASLNATVYVYPDACRTEIGEPLAEACPREG